MRLQLWVVSVLGAIGARGRAVASALAVGAALAIVAAPSDGFANRPEPLVDPKLAAERAEAERLERLRLAEIATQQRMRRQQLAMQLAQQRRQYERYRLAVENAALSPFAQEIARDERILVSRHNGAHIPNEIVVDVERRVLHFHTEDGVRVTFPVATARPDLQEYGVMRITKKRPKPTWIPTPNQRRLDPTLPQVVRPGPENPLGSRALNLSRGYLRIHGTNEPQSIGHAVSDGCVRLANEHVELLYEMVDVGMTVEIR